VSRSGESRYASLHPPGVSNANQSARQNRSKETAPALQDGFMDLQSSSIRWGLVVNFFIVTQFVIEREILGAGTLSETQIREIALQSLQTLKEMGPQIQWLHSYVTEDKVYCIYLAPDEDSIREHARRVGIPADRVSSVRRLIDPAKFK
jgi:Nickel responsive protein SCO4226-like